VTTTEVQSGLEGVVAFATEIAEPDKEGGGPRLRGLDTEGPRRDLPVQEGWEPARDRPVGPRPCARPRSRLPSPR